MKRVFAFISLFAIAFVMFGFATQNVQAADKEPAAGKWFENPYLYTDEAGNVVEIPMYIMNSITTTFPDFFDYEGAKGTEFEDKNWGGSVRQYAWNGVKVLIPQFDENGATGKYYGAYPQGASKGGEVGIGGMIYTTSGQWDQGTWYNGGSYARLAPHDPSLSFYLFNDKAEEVSIAPYAKENAANPYMIFDAAGKAVGGVILPDTSVNAVETQYGLGTEFCWDENGAGVVANEDASNCARVMVDGEEDDLDKPILDEEGNPTGEYEKIQVPGEDPNYITYRFVWKYMEAAPANLNNGYLNDGWKADNWDFYDAEKQVAVAILSSAFNLGGAVSGAELTADESIAAGHIRAPFNEVVIPAGGLLYKFGYLERTSTLLPTYKEVQAQAYLYGREEGYSQFVKCYNYATRDITFVNKAIDGLGYSLINGNTVEAVAGAQIDFKQLINLDGVAYCFTDVNNPFSFQSAVLSDDEEAALFKAKYAEFLAAAIEEVKVSEDYKDAYGDYKAWLDKQLTTEAGLKAAVEKAQAELDAAIADKNNILATAEQTVKNSNDAAVKVAYNSYLEAIANAEKAITAKKAEIKDWEDKIASRKQVLEAFEAEVRVSPEYLGYKQALTHAFKNFKDTLKLVRSYVALELGSDPTQITLADLEYTAEPTPEEDYLVVFKNAELAAAYAKIVAAVAETYADDKVRQEAIDAAAAEFTAAFKIETGNTFEKNYAAKVEAFVRSVTNLAIANKAIKDYIQLSDVQRQTLLDNIAAAEAGKTKAEEELGKETPATGLFKDLADAKAAKEDYIISFVEGTKDWNDALAKIAAKEEALAKAKEALGAPSTATTPATGFYVAYEAEAIDMNRILEELAKPFAEKAFADWKKNVYFDQMSLDYTVVVNGEMIVFKSEFQSKADFLETFMAEFHAWCVENGKVAANVTLEQFMHSDAAAKDYKGVYAGLGGADTFKPFLEANAERWEAAINFFTQMRTGHDLWASPWGTYTIMFVKYCQGATHSYGPVDQATLESYPKPVAWDEFVLGMSTNINEKTDVQVIVKNPILGKSSELNLDFVVCADKYDVTPVIEINSANLYVTDPKSFDVRSIASAYDKVWSEATGIKGNDISSQIDFICPELDAALASGVACGKFPVEMKVRNFNTRKEVTATATVTIVDQIAPVIESRDVQVNYGEDFYFMDGVYFAYDNVDGNMFEQPKFMFTAEQDEVNTYEAGEYTVVVSVMDSSGNSAETEYVVYVNEKEEFPEIPEVDFGPVFDAIEDLAGAVEDAKEEVKDEIQDAEDNVTDKVEDSKEEVKDEIGNVGDNLGDQVADSEDAILGGQEGINNAINGVGNTAQDTLNQATNAAKEAADDTLVIVATVLAGVAALASVGAVVLVVLKKK